MSWKLKCLFSERKNKGLSLQMAELVYVTAETGHLSTLGQLDNV